MSVVLSEAQVKAIGLVLAEVRFGSIAHHKALAEIVYVVENPNDSEDWRS